MKHRLSLAFKLLGPLAAIGALFFAIVLIVTQAGFASRLRTLERKAAAQTINRGLDIVQAEIRSIRDIAGAFAMSDIPDSDYPGIMEAMELDFLSLAANGARFNGVPGWLRVNGEIIRITDTGALLEQNRKETYTTAVEQSYWGFYAMEEPSEIYLLAADTGSEGRSIALGRHLSSVLRPYRERNEKGLPVFDGARPSPGTKLLKMSVTDTGHPDFPELNPEDLNFTDDPDHLETALIFQVPYLENGLSVSYSIRPGNRLIGLMEMRRQSLLYLAALILMMTLMAMWTFRVISRPLNHLLRGIRTWDGLRLPDMGKLTDRNDEIGLLADTFITMSGEISSKARSLDEQAVRDGLTGLFNRRYFDEALISEWDRHKRKNLSLALLMADIDGFNAFNDIYGHPEGDVCLRRVAQVCTDSVKRPGDIPFRYGGGSLALILTDTDADGALKVAEGIRKELVRLKIPHKGNAGEGIVTLSLGVSTCRPGSDEECGERGKLLRRAEEALNQAKKNGKNKVISN